MTYNNQKTKKKKRLNTKYKKIYKGKQLTWLRIPYKTKKNRERIQIPPPNWRSRRNKLHNISFRLQNTN